jgi:hypothetical protein
VIQPDGVADDFGRKPVSAIGGGLSNHAVSLACLPPKRQARLTCQCPWTLTPAGEGTRVDFVIDFQF